MVNIVAAKITLLLLIAMQIYVCSLYGNPP
jgi:hypothetical protein